MVLHHIDHASEEVFQLVPFRLIYNGLKVREMNRVIIYRHDRLENTVFHSPNVLFGNEGLFGQLFKLILIMIV